MKTLKKLNRLTIIALVLVIGLFGCKSGQQKEKAHEEIPEKPEAEQQTVKIASTEYPIPTAFEITQMINNAGASYIYDLSNSVDNVDKYFTEKEKAINLGIYGADLSYASTYQKKQETMQFLDASKKLIEDLNIATSFNKELARQVENNIDNKDTLISIITDSFYDTYEFLMDNGKDDLSIFVLTGSWVEGLYIATQLTMNAQDKSEFKQVILSQKESLNELFKIMEQNKENEDIAEMIEKLSGLKSAFDSFESEITDEQLKTVISRVESIRNDLI